MVHAGRKGRDAENRMATYLRVNGYEAELLRLAGTDDRGDLWVPATNHRVEIKNHANVLSGINLAMKDVDQLNALFPDSNNVAVVRRSGQPTGEWYVVNKVRHLWPDISAETEQTHD